MGDIGPSRTMIESAIGLGMLPPEMQRKRLCKASEDQAPISSLKAGRILITWRRLELQRFAIDLVRQPVAAGALAMLLTSMVMALRWAFQHEPQSQPSRLVVETGTSAFTFALLARGVAGIEARGPLQGVFLPLVTGGSRRIGYRLLETTLLWLAVVASATVALVSLAPDRLASLLAATAAGLLLASSWLWVGRSRTPQQTDAIVDEGVEARSLRGPMLVARRQWRCRVGPVPAWAGGAIIAAATAVAAVLARRNNSNADVGEAVLAGGALLGGAVCGRIDPKLVRFIGHEPLTLLRIIASAALPTPVVVALATGLAGLVLGPGAATACGIGAGVGGLLATYLSAAVLHALGGRPRFASFAAGVDLIICAAFLMIYAPLLWVWAPVRAVALIGQARRRRWTDL